MNESILQALMKLFAILANVSDEGLEENERDVVHEYLHRQFSNDLVELYLSYFDRYMDEFKPELTIIDDKHHQETDNFTSNLINSICSTLNEELEHKQKIIILIHLLNFISRGEKQMEKEIEVIAKVSKNLNISDETYSDIKEFSFDQFKKIKRKENILSVSAEDIEKGRVKHLKINKIKGNVFVFRIEKSATLIFRYHGNEQLFMNGHLIKPFRTNIWSFGSVLKSDLFGSIYYVWVAGKFIEDTNKARFVFTAKDIEYTYGQSSNGIKRFTFTEESGRLIGIIGGSGCGKSTLLKVLNGNIKPKGGKITINGFDIHENSDDLKGILGYVPQEEMLIKELTVFQNLYYNAKLCFSEYTEEQINEVVEKALLNFDLVEASDLIVGKAFRTVLSGGQRKRLNIALELMREPAILFVDEPTSGLSSMDSEKVMIMLKRQTFKGKLIIANIHQPSADVFKLLDKLLVMDQGGRVIYYGNPLDAINYFKRANKYVDAEESECLTCGNINPDQILRNIEMRVVDVNGRLTRKRKTSPEEWYEMYMHNIDPIIKKIKRPYIPEIPPSSFKPPKRLRQMGIYFVRDILAKLSNKQYLTLSFIEAPLLALILAFFTKNANNLFAEVQGYSLMENVNIPAYLFMSVIVMLFLGMVISAEEIFKDRKILEREKFLNLSRGSYLFSKIFLMFAISAIQTLLFVLIGNYILEIRGMAHSYFLILFSASCCANMMGLNISSGLNSVVTIYIIIPLIMVPQLLFSGVVINFNNMNSKIVSEKYVPFIGDVTPSRWAYEALAVNQFKNNRFQKHFFNVEQEINHVIFYRSYVLPEMVKLLDEVKENIAVNTMFAKVNENLLILRNELVKIQNNLETDFLFNLDDVVFERFNIDLYKGIIQFLIDAERIYHGKYLNAIEKKEVLFSEFTRGSGTGNYFMTLKRKHHNKQLESIVSNAGHVREFAIINNEIVKTKDPIYVIPDSKYGRAHFYAPYKRIGNSIIHTMWFNIAVIWLYSIILFVILYYDLLRWLINHIERMKLERLNKRLIKILKQIEMISLKSKG